MHTYTQPTVISSKIAYMYANGNSGVYAIKNIVNYMGNCGGKYVNSKTQ